MREFADIMISQEAEKARDKLADQLEADLRKLDEGDSLAVGPLFWTEGEGFSRKMILMHAGTTLADSGLTEDRWTVYKSPPRLTFNYTNHRGERGWRTVVRPRIYFGQTTYYPEDQWLVEAFDMDRMEPRTFALDQMEIGKEAIE